jgi:hypothetical protein
MKQRFCSRCKTEIPAERIEAIPETRICVKCSADVGGEFELVFEDESLGKAGSLKKNYGSVTVRKRRRELRD